MYTHSITPINHTLFSDLTLPLMTYQTPSVNIKLIAISTHWCLVQFISNAHQMNLPFSFLSFRFIQIPIPSYIYIYGCISIDWISIEMKIEICWLFSSDCKCQRCHSFKFKTEFSYFNETSMTSLDYPKVSVNFTRYIEVTLISYFIFVKTFSGMIDIDAIQFVNLSYIHNW